MQQEQEAGGEEHHQLMEELLLHGQPEQEGVDVGVSEQSSATWQPLMRHCR